MARPKKHSDELRRRAIDEVLERVARAPRSPRHLDPDLVQRQLVASRSNQLWLADITYGSTWGGWLYLAFILETSAPIS